MKKSIFLLSYLLVLLGKQVHAATPLQASQSHTMGFQVNATGPNALNGLTATGASNTSSGSNLAAVATTTTVWATAYQVNVTLTNNTAQPTSSWTAQFTLPAGNVLS